LGEFLDQGTLGLRRFVQLLDQPDDGANRLEKAVVDLQLPGSVWTMFFSPRGAKCVKLW